MSKKPRAISVAEFSPILRSLGLLGEEMIPPPLAVGLTGNPESLALIALIKSSIPTADLTAITFDHGQSPAASALAKNLSHRMAAMGIKHKILLSPLSEPGSGMRGDSCLPVLSQAQDSRMSFKTLGKHLDARRSLTLLKECKSLSLSHLILGHKLEDHLYALMKSFRTAATPALGYYGIPLTNGLSALNYHARIYRPLLPFPLDRIRETCIEHGLEFQDSAVNPLHFSRFRLLSELETEGVSRLADDCSGDGSDQVDSLLKFSGLMNRQQISLKDKVRGIIRDNVRFDYSMGIAMVKVNVAAHESSKHWISNKMVAEAVLAHVVKKVFGDVFFDPMLHATALENFRQGLLRMLGPQKRQMMSGSGTLMNPPRASVTGHRVWLFCRQPFDNETRKRNTFSFRLGETALWDGRFIISSSLPQSSTDSSSPSSFPQKDPPGLEFVMRPFTSYDYQKILSRLAPKGTTAQPGPHRIYQRILSHFWDVMPAAARQTLPCVAVKSRGGSSESVAIALPSLGINLEPSLGNFDCSFVMDREASEIQLDSLPNLDAYWR